MAEYYFLSDRTSFVTFKWINIFADQLVLVRQEPQSLNSIVTKSMSIAAPVAGNYSIAKNRASRLYPRKDKNGYPYPDLHGIYEGYRLSS